MNTKRAPEALPVVQSAKVRAATARDILRLPGWYARGLFMACPLWGRWLLGVALCAAVGMWTLGASRSPWARWAAVVLAAIVALIVTIWLGRLAYRLRRGTAVGFMSPASHPTAIITLRWTSEGWDVGDHAARHVRRGEGKALRAEMLAAIEEQIPVTITLAAAERPLTAYRDELESAGFRVTVADRRRRRDLKHQRITASRP